jgi:hypothetical protein
VAQHGATVLRVCRAVVGPDAARRAAADGIKTLRKTYQKDETA